MIIIGAALFASLLITSCSGNKTDETQNNEQTQTKKKTDHLAQ